MTSAFQPPNPISPDAPAAGEASAVDTLLAAERARILRFDPTDAARAARAGALLVDIRPSEDRRSFGLIPDALIIGRNVLEWRLDPTGADRIPDADDPDRAVIVLCNEGYASSLAAASLRDLGRTNTADLIGGFHAWAAAGLPVVPEG